MIGMGTLLNIVAILIGSTLGVLIGHRIPERTRRTVTDGLGLVVLVIGGLNVVALSDADYVSAVSAGGTLLIVIGAILIGGIIGSSLRIEDRMEALGGWLQNAFGRRARARSAGKDSGRELEGELEGELESEVYDETGRSRFIEGFVDASLVFCIGPLAILGALNDGLGNGIDQLALKSTLDGFASLAFAASLGWGVALSALAVGAWQGLVTIIGVFAGQFLSAALIASITATGGVLLLGVGLRMLHIRQVPVGNLLPALIVAPVLTVVVGMILAR